MIQYVDCITLMSTGSRHYQVPHFILTHITRCPALFSHIFFPAFYPLSLPHPALPLFTHSPRQAVCTTSFFRKLMVDIALALSTTPYSDLFSGDQSYG